MEPVEAGMTHEHLRMRGAPRAEPGHAGEDVSRLALELLSVLPEETEEVVCAFLLWLLPHGPHEYGPG